MTSSKTILVVGGAGYIGSHTVLALEAQGYGVVIYDNLSTGHCDVCEGRMLVEGDLSDRALLMKTFNRHKIDAVIHFAALIEAGISVTDPLPFFANNVGATIVLLDVMQEVGVTRLVFSSTAAVYGNASTNRPLTEDLPNAPINPYGASKAMVETILSAQAKAKGLNAIALRYFNASGADPLGRSGERHDPETHLIPLVLRTAKGERGPLSIFGTDYDTPDGSCVRDYIHVVDLAEGHIAALRALENQTGGSFAAFNLGTGKGHSVLDVIKTAEKVTKIPIAANRKERRIGDPAILVADATAAGTVLGWQARRSDLETIIKDAWSFENGR